MRGPRLPPQPPQLAELAATVAQDYVRLAVALANDPDRLRALRTGLREQMCCAPLMDVVGFTRSLEDRLIQLYRRIEPEVTRSA